MSENASWAVQKSIYSALKTSPDLIAQLGDDSIYDDIPRSASYPYIRFGQSVVRDFSSSSERGFEHSIVLHVWSKGQGKKESFDIMEQIRSALDDQPLAVSDHHLVNMRCEQMSVRKESESQSYHGVLRYRIVTEVV